MTFTSPKNNNYCAIVTKLETFKDLENCDNVKHALIFGYHVIVSKDVKEGDIGLFFPPETRLLRNFLSNNNLYRRAEFGNVDDQKTGFFELHGRVKTVKFRGHKSEGFWVPLTTLNFLNVPLSNFTVGLEFDSVNGVLICEKYIPASNPPASSNKHGAKKAVKMIDRIAENQFRFHYDTENLRRNSHKLNPTDIISISEKIHGTSIVVGNLLINRPLSIFEKIFKFFGGSVVEKKYDIIWSSRRVIKGVSEWTNENTYDYYNSDIYTKVKLDIEKNIPKGFTVYGEVAGYVNSNDMIQKNYTYGCGPGEYILRIYRVTFTNEDGTVFELSWNSMLDFCNSYNLKPVTTLYHGRACDLFSHIPYVKSDDLSFIGKWREDFVSYLEKTFVENKACWFNKKLPAEGIVLRLDHLNQSEAFKLKSFEFLNMESKELDSAVMDIETMESL